MNKNISITEAIKNAGGYTATAKAVGARNYQTVQQWEITGQVPVIYCQRLEKVSGIPRVKFRPKDASLIWPELN